MAHNTILVWPEGPVPPVIAERLTTLMDPASKRRFIRFRVGDEIAIAPEENVTRLDRLYPAMTGAELSSYIGNA